MGGEPRTLCVVTGTRAEYGHLHWVMRDIQADPRLRLQVIAAGMHLSPEFGLTVTEIEADGFAIDARVEMLLSSDTPVGMTKSMGLGLIGFADALDRLQPDMLVILGDRFEAMAAAQAAVAARIPIAHLHGGEASEGVMDEAWRHAITKMSHLHFTAAEPYRRRVIQLGEQPERVFDVGAPGLDHLTRAPLLDRTAWQAETGFELGPTNILVTYHPVTCEAAGPEPALDALFSALDAFPEAHVLFTRANADADGRRINRLIEDYVAARPQRAALRASLGSKRYFSALRLMDAVVGNSSSALIEAPCFDLPAVNLGDRQRGRLKGASVIDCAETPEAVLAGLQRALDPAFRAGLKGSEPPYGRGGAAGRIVATLRDHPLDDILKKRFYNLADIRATDNRAADNRPDAGRAFP